MNYNQTMGASHVVPVNLAGDSYKVHVQPGLLADIGRTLSTVTSAKHVVLLSDSNVAPRFVEPLRSSLVEAGIELRAECILPPGEDHKTLSSVGQALDIFLQTRIERSTPLLALGGGVIGDMAGFIAAIALRGIPFVQIPTTLLSMVDASVGGKTGVNHPTGKNLIGSFHQPLAVFADPQTLRTLPPRQFISGLAECIKHDLIRDAAGFDYLEQNINSIRTLQMDALTKLVAHNVAIKAKVVEADPFENGERAHLNFGHTFGHAIEKVSEFSYSHGESVALGMLCAAHVSTKLDLLEESSRRRIQLLIQRAGLPIGKLNLPADAILNAMSFDKKVKTGRIRFVLLDGIGKAVIHDDVPPHLVLQAIQSIQD